MDDKQTIPGSLAQASIGTWLPWPIEWPRYTVPLVPFLALSLVVCLLTIRRYLLSIFTARWRLLAQSLVAGIFIVIFTVESLCRSTSG